MTTDKLPLAINRALVVKNTENRRLIIVKAMACILL